MSQTAFFADWGLHVGIGTMMACTNGCVKRFCSHKVKRYAIASSLILAEGAITVAVIG